MLRHMHWNLALAGLALLCLGYQARAADVDAKLLPDDTEIIAAVHVRQALESPLGKKFVVEKLREGLKSQAQAEAILQDLGFDPMKDLDLAVFAGPGGDNQEKGLILAYGTYDLAKINAKAEEVAKNQGEHLKISTVGTHKLYEVNQPDGKNIYVSFASKNLALASPNKDYLTAALQKVDSKSSTASGVKSAEVKSLLARVDRKQTVWIVATTAALPKGLPLDNSPKLKEGMANVQGIVGGLNVGEDLKLAVQIINKDAKSAKQLAQTMSEGLNQIKQALGFAGANNPQTAVLVEVLGAIKIGEPKENVVAINATMTSELIGKLAKMAQGGK